jgi:hypothetical protein
MPLKLSRLVYLMLVPSAALVAQRWEIAPTASYVRPGHAPLGSLPDNSSNKDTDTKLKMGPGLGVRFTRNTRGYYGYEGTYLRTRNVLSARITPYTGNAVTREDTIYTDYIAFNALCYFMPVGEKWRPFITAGMNMQRYGEPKFAEWTEGASRNYGGNFGGGIKLMLMKNALVRFDLRDYIGGKPYGLQFQDEQKFGGGWMHTIEASVGISIAF